MGKAEAKKTHRGTITIEFDGNKGSWPLEVASFESEGKFGGMTVVEFVGADVNKKRKDGNKHLETRIGPLVTMICKGNK